MIRAAVLAILCATPVVAQEYSPADVPHGQKDYHAAAAGSYKLDPMHTALVTRVLHLGFSYSLFRFDKPSATLEWNPDDPAKSKLSAQVQIDSISTPVEGFAQYLLGKEYLDAATNPTATFVSDSFTAQSDTGGTVTGQLTIMGKTHPATFDVELIGAGKGYTGDAQGNPIIRDLIGLQAETEIDPQAYGLNAFFTAPIPIQIDAEFVRQE
ncbi:YceI family protein [Paracoccus laeviglucosivorans]|uniref:Polyisoprenoid-binding protein YceI n=1 Tax=Paracoccus laeviglucosivorans TaxID=1197861 RepID=A0A521FGR5_9RHOB|nr:YceI family protein [Paracoccus laeviglucosivorans]SMO95184.1 Polyisoprenoid-binding protein YceI [Paracoccus laeviglucosivorans]